MLITVISCRFKLRPTLSLLFLTHFISSIMSSLLSTSTAVSSGRVAVFIFHVTFPIPVTISPTPPLFLKYSIYRLNGTGNKIQPCVTPFAVVKVQLASYSVCRSRINTVKCLVIPTLLMLFYIFECCRLSKFCVICQTV